MILVVGGAGMLGRDLPVILAGDVRGTDLPEIDITCGDSVRRTVLTLKPRVIVNAAAYTDVDGCETNTELAMRVNGEGVRHLAEAAKETGALLVQVSTDYVFDGSKGSPYRENDPTNPLSVYGKSKLLGEENARLAPDHLIVRTQWLYGLHGKNFVETMLRVGPERGEVAVVDDQVGSPTWTHDLARAIKVLIEKGCRGTYHVASSGSCSWNGFAKEIFAQARLDVPVRPLSTTELGRPAPRPLFSVLETAKLSSDTGYSLPGWEEALRGYLRERRGAQA